jgi:MoaA/NifB/PqqE/SkfB family radical SAM enzyme
MPAFRCLLLSGGEPFLRRRLDEIMLAFVKNNGVTSISIPTNGWYLERTEQACTSFLQQSSGVTLTLNFSVDGLEATHNAIRGKDNTFAKLCATIEHLSPLRELYPDLRFRMNSVVTPDNINEMKAPIDFFHERYALDEHGLEMVRDLHVVGAQHDSPERKAIADRYVDLVRYAYDLYFKNGAAKRGKLGYLPEGMSNVLNYAHNLAMAEVRRDRINGELWSFPCTAGRKILVIDGSGSLSACEHRGEVVDLRAFDFDVGQALAGGAMDEERRQIGKDRCDCIHGCFIGNSLQHSPRSVVTKMLPKALSYFSPARVSSEGPEGFEDLERHARHVGQPVTIGRTSSRVETQS